MGVFGVRGDEAVGAVSTRGDRRGGAKMYVIGGIVSRTVHERHARARFDDGDVAAVEDEAGDERVTRRARGPSRG